ncbi:integron integrase [Vibrio sp. Hep-1b-8]|uniref:integron integrase n=1 Tax=Vibrio sp. Hep-1b-8 TaxID=2144187 RepID=UPI001110BC76|nr:integron integrase [Vibrio sp. Hep-1b-8]TMX33297.1 integron integrase [Vibrio sp. Hep-1b-8]
MKSQFLLSVKEHMYARHYSAKTIEAYLLWITKYIVFNGKVHPSKLNEQHVEDFLTYLAVEKNVAAKTQALALNAVCFLYRDYFRTPLSVEMKFQKSSLDRKLPIVLTKQEARRFFNQLDPRYRLPIMLLYGSGLRVMECVRLRVQDIDFDYKALRVWQGKGGKNRIVTLAVEAIPLLREQQSLALRYYKKDIHSAGYAGVHISPSLQRKFPQAELDFNWHFLFPSHRLTADPYSGELRRHHINATSIQRAVKRTAIEAGIKKESLSSPFLNPNH